MPGPNHNSLLCNEHDEQYSNWVEGHRKRSWHHRYHVVLRFGHVSLRLRIDIPQRAVQKRPLVPLDCRQNQSHADRILGP